MRSILPLFLVVVGTMGYSQDIRQLATDDFRPMPESVHSPLELKDLYRNSGYRPLWTNRIMIGELIRSVGNAGDDGLSPSDYHYDALKVIGGERNHSPQADILLSDAWLTLARHLAVGRLNPVTLFPSDWDRPPASPDVVVSLLQALNDETVGGSLEAAKPTDALYCRLKSELMLVGAADTTAVQADSIQEYRTQLLVNLEKCRWLAASRPGLQLQVNIPSFGLRLVDHDSVVMEMKVIVGRSERKTPVLTSTITSLVVNPDWTVPPTILKEDVLPAARRDSEYLRRNNLRLIGRDGVEVQPDSLPWSSYDEHNFPFVIKQDPGARNSLGLIKFQFANRFGVYLHDTNMHALFAHGKRAFSSGCVRIEKPFALASYLLRATDWDLQELTASGVTTSIPLSERLPLQITYFTVYWDNNGMLQSFGDVYNWDTAIRQALNLPAPTP